MKNSDASYPDRHEKDSPSEEPFLRRWSKRKLEAASTREIKVADEQKPALPTESQQTERGADGLLAEAPEKDLSDDDMPPIETLDENSDYSGFFSPKVSETLRRQALRKLFHFQQFNITDGLNDYDDDYTSFAKLGNTVTHDMRRLLEREKDALKETGVKAEHKEDAEDYAASEKNEDEEKVVASSEPIATGNEEDAGIDLEPKELL